MGSRANGECLRKRDTRLHHRNGLTLRIVERLVSAGLRASRLPHDAHSGDVGGVAAKDRATVCEDQITGTQGAIARPSVRMDRVLAHRERHVPWAVRAGLDHLLHHSLRDDLFRLARL